jgi:chromosome segregation ATPase
MHTKLHSTHVLGSVAILLLLFAAATVSQAQTCTEKLELARQRVQQLEATITHQKDQVLARDNAIKDQQALIDLKNEKIEKQQEKIDIQRETIANLDSTIAELKKQTATLEENVKLTQQNAQLQQNIAQINAAFIEVQKTAITALVKMGKRSALEKFVDALPSIAGIIAVALTHK